MTDRQGNGASGDGNAALKVEDVASAGNGEGTLELTKKDFASDQETRWCPGCGDYAILAGSTGLS